MFSLSSIGGIRWCKRIMWWRISSRPLSVLLTSWMLFSLMDMISSIPVTFTLLIPERYLLVISFLRNALMMSSWCGKERIFRPSWFLKLKAVLTLQWHQEHCFMMLWSTTCRTDDSRIICWCQWWASYCFMAKGNGMPWHHCWKESKDQRKSRENRMTGRWGL